uniref:MAM domain-containing protein, meprin/A5/mu n=1 Tax=Candidatus Kentrum sp. SD TaxID=2126332 RepID=A0A451BNC6_9GAMM|nr:MAG: MAM domain-containing protein, meprin/A5/mu [Candidatus Kentron sp. SD]
MSDYAQLNPTLVPTRLRRSLLPTRLPGNLSQTWHNAAKGGRARLVITIPCSTTTLRVGGASHMKTTRPFRPFSRLGKTKTPDEPPPKSRPTPFRERREALTGFLAVLLGLAAPAHALEHTTGFEVDIRGWTVIKGTSQFNWARQTRGTHSGHTGPSGAHEGDYYLYLEASRNYPARTAYLQSREFSGKIQKVSFHYHMYGAHMGSLALEGLDGNSWFTLWTTTGQQHPNHQAPWTRQEVTLSGRTIQKIRFKGTTTDNPNGGQYRGDMAIDYITVTTENIMPLRGNWWHHWGLR